MTTADLTTSNRAAIGSPANCEEIEMKVSRPAAKTPAAVERPFSLRGFTSLLLVLCLLLLLASGLALYLAPRGRIANSTAWTALALSRQQWAAVHINASLLFVVMTTSHLVMNWSRLVGYMKKRSRPGIHMKRELAMALAVASAIVAGTVLELPPISIPVDGKYILRDAWEQPAGRPAVGYGTGASVRLTPVDASPLRLSERVHAGSKTLSHSLPIE